MKIIDGSLRNSTAVVVGMILVTLFGVLALRAIPIQLNPTIEQPFITVETTYRGASALEVEQEITVRQEKRLAAVDRLREMRSESSEGQSQITLQFDWGIRKDLAQLDVLQKLNLVEDLPSEADEAQILTVNRSEEETVNWLYLDIGEESGLTVNQVRRIVDDFVLPQMERIEDVATVRRFGGEEREIHVLVDLMDLTARDLALNDISEALRRENRNVRGGDIERGGVRHLVRTPAQFTSLDEIRQTIIAGGEDGPIRIGDVARVEDGFEDRQVIVRVNGRPTIVMGVVKQPGTNTINIAGRVHETLARLNQELAPRGLTIRVAQDASDYIWESIIQVRDSLLLGGLLAIIVLWLYLRSIYTTMILAITIPLCMVGTFILLLAFGRSVNVISLAGLAFASGMILDNGIVVIENIFRHRTELGKPVLTAARDGAMEVWAAIVAASLTTLAVFLPILFIQEMAGQLFRDIAYSISFAVALSMVSAITVVPMLASRLLGRVAVRNGASENVTRVKPTPAEPRWRRWLHPGRMLHRVIDPVLGGLAWGVASFFHGVVGMGLRRWTACLAVIATLATVFVVSLRLVPPAEYLPSGNRNLLIAFFRMPSGMSLERCEQLLQLMEEEVLALPEYERTFFIVRRDNPIFGVVLKPEYSDKDSIQRVVQQLQASASSHYPFPDVLPIVNQAQIFGRGITAGKGLSIDIRGPDLRRLEELSDRVTDQVRRLPGVRSVRPSIDLANPELHVLPDRARLSDLGLTASDVADAVEVMVEGRIVSEYREDGKEYDMVLKGIDQQIAGPEDLSRVSISTPQGDKVKLVDVARIERRLGPVKVEHLEQERSVSLAVNIDEDMPLEPVIAAVNQQVLDPLRAELPFDYVITLSGSADDLARTMAALAESFLLALMIIYLLMAALFRSFLYPAIIMFSVPMAMSGAFLALWWTQAEFNVITMLGFILLAGVVVNNAILIVDVTLTEVRKGATHNDAIREAVRRRLRPVFMTSSTSVLGMLPLALGSGSGAELYNGLGVAMVGGLACSTLFTLVLIPMLLRLFLTARDGLANRLGREEMTEAGRAKALEELDEAVS